MSIKPVPTQSPKVSPRAALPRTPTATAPSGGFTFPTPAPPTNEIYIPGMGMPPPTKKPVNPYEKPFQELANSPVNQYSGALDTLVGNVGGLGNKDYTAALREMMLEDVNRAQGKFDSQLRGMGMGELSLAPDVTDRWAKERTDASTRAAVQGQELQRGAYETASNVIARASGVQLNAFLAQLQALTAGGSNYNDYMQMLIPLMLEKGRAGGGGTGGAQQTPILGSRGSY